MKKGFTLVELLAVIVILGLLAAITIPSVMNNVYATKDAAYKQLVSELEQTTQLYVRDNKDNLTGINVVGNKIEKQLKVEQAIDPERDK